MSGMVAWFARNHVAANLLMLLIAFAGLVKLGLLSGFAHPLIKREVFPEFATDTIAITVAYPGASPEEVENGICIRIEEEVASLEGVDRVRSTAAEGLGTVLVEALEGTDRRRLLDDVKSRIDAIDNFPDEAEEPVVREMTWKRQVLNVAVSGDIDEMSLKRLAERVRDDLTALPGITQAEVVAVRPYEVSIEVAEDALRRYGITFDTVVRAVSTASLDLPGGSVKTSGGEILLRSLGQAYVQDDFARLVLLTRDDGTRVLLEDVATVVDGFADTDQSARFDGAPGALVQVYRVGDQDALDISATVRGYCERTRATFPAGVTITPWLDQAEILKSRQDLLVRNGLAGFALVFLVLALFLRLELAIWVSLGIPISFLGAIALMPALDVSINMLSLFAFILVLGIVVDDAIVVGENVYSHSQRGSSGIIAAIAGTQEVAVPVMFAVLTTIAAFVPMLNVPGNTGPFWAMIPAVVIPTLVFSMIESKLILPAHLRHLQPRAGRRAGPLGWWDSVQTLFASGLERFAIRLYRPSLEFALRHRYTTVAAAWALLFVTGGLVGGGYVKFVFFPPVDGDNVVCNLEMPEGTPVERTAAIVRRIEAAALQLRDELDADRGAATSASAPPIRHVLTSIGEQPYRKIQQEGGGRLVAGGFSGGHLGEVNIQLAPAELRDFTSQAVADRWRELVGPVFGASELKFSSSLISVGADIDVRLAGQDLGVLQLAAERLKEHLATIDGVYDVTDSIEAGKEELELRVRPEAETIGVTQLDLARQVRQGFYGEEVQRIQRGRDDVRVMVRYPAAERRSLADVERMRVRTTQGDEIPFRTVAEIERGRGFSTIQRTDRARAVSVFAEVDETRVDVNEITRELAAGFLPQLLAQFPGTSFAFEGERREQAETIGGLIEGFLIALVLIYVLLAIPFRSYVQPLVVMLAIPFGLIGAVLGHVLQGVQLSVLSVCGVVALSGVVVNDSLVLVDFINKHRDDEGSLAAAIRAAGVRRFRPILLTSLTTFAGLLPLLSETSVQARFLIPMAISLGYGVMFSTAISLLLIPAGYLMLDDLSRSLRSRWARLWGRAIEPAPVD
ncbi:MAG: efflux RND transporter permease subunit [Planctomycetes bacterium]|nr:efflux RND transporter permease subunit [Planctomycetota bacterium]